MVLTNSRGKQEKLAFTVTGLSHDPILTCPQNPFFTRASSIQTVFFLSMYALRLPSPTFQRPVCSSHPDHACSAQVFHQGRRNENGRKREKERERGEERERVREREKVTGTHTHTYTHKHATLPPHPPPHAHCTFTRTNLLFLAKAISNASPGLKRHKHTTLRTMSSHACCP